MQLGTSLSLTRAGVAVLLVQLLTVEGAPIQTVEAADLIVRKQSNG